MAKTKTYKVVSINPPPRMPKNINRDFELTIKPGSTIKSVRSGRPAFAKVRSYKVITPGVSKMVLKVSIHGMNAGTLNVPFSVNFNDGAAQFVIRVV